MKLFLCLIILIYSSCYGHEKKFHKNENEIIKSYHKFGDNNDFQTHQNIQRNGNLLHREYFREYDEYGKNTNSDEEYIGNPDFDSKIERPCRVFDLNCIRKYFADHSKCKIRRGPLPRSFTISQETLYYPRVNLSITGNNLRIGGFRNTRIEEFYINRHTNKMVFSINIRDFTKLTPSSFFTFYCRDREPVVILTEALDIFPSVTFTAIIPNINDLQLDKAEITAYVDAVNAFFLGPELTNNTDPTVAQSLVELFADVPTNDQELMLTDSYFYLPTYIQYNICDFGITNL